MAITRLRVSGAAGAPPVFGQRTAIALPETAITAVDVPAYATAGSERGALRVLRDEDTRVEPIRAGDWPIAPGLTSNTLRPSETRLEWRVQGVGIRCGWLLPETDHCAIGTTKVSPGVPDDAVGNFENQVALLSVTFERGAMTRGGTLPVTLVWQPLQPIETDYTVFVQLIGADGRLYGQVDQFPLQGVHPTSAWTLGETVVDPYRVPLSFDAPSGDYQLAVGMYSLSTGRRLTLYDAANQPIGDAVVFDGLSVEEPNG